MLIENRNFYVTSLIMVYDLNSDSNSITGNTAETTGFQKHDEKLPITVLFFTLFFFTTRDHSSFISQLNEAIFAVWRVAAISS